MFREGLQIIRNDVGEHNLNYFVSMANFAFFLSVIAQKYSDSLII